MRISRIIEFVAGIGIAALAIFLYAYGEIMNWQNPDMQFNVTVELFFFMIAMPGVLIGIGAYVHAIKNRLWGHYLLNITAGVNNFLIVALLSGIVWFYPGWVVLLFLIQFFLVLVAVAAAYFQHTQSNKRLQLTAR